MNWPRPVRLRLSRARRNVTWNKAITLTKHDAGGLPLLLLSVRVDRPCYKRYFSPALLPLRDCAGYFAFHPINRVHPISLTERNSSSSPFAYKSYPNIWPTIMFRVRIFSCGIADGSIWQTEDTWTVSRPFRLRTYPRTVRRTDPSGKVMFRVQTHPRGIQNATGLCPSRTHLPAVYPERRKFQLF